MPIDPHVSMVVTRFLERSRVGQEKYGTDLTRSDLSLKDWLKHAQEEAMDFVLYLETARAKLEEAGD